jgi:site-specific DNA recombinase
MPDPVAVAYCRVSTEEQRERETVATQREAIERWAQSAGITIRRWYTDEGYSGSLEPDQRPGLMALLEDANRGLFRLLVIYRIDRLSRDAAIYFNLERQLRRMGVTVVSVTEGALDDDTAAGHLRRGVLAVFSDFERRLIRERSVAGQRRLAAQGQYMGGCRPFGYRVEGRNRQAHLVPD